MKCQENKWLYDLNYDYKSTKRAKCGYIIFARFHCLYTRLELKETVMVILKSCNFYYIIAGLLYNVLLYSEEMSLYIPLYITALPISISVRQ